MTTAIIDHAGRAAKPESDAFLDLPFAIYRNDPNWVAPLYLERCEHLDPKKNPYFRHADVELFLAERDGRFRWAASRRRSAACAASIYKDGVGQFGFLEAEDDPAVFAALFEAASGWLKARGMTRIQGPFSFSINDETGLLIDGFDTPPNMLMGHAPPYYARRIEEQGFAKAKDVFAYDYVDETGVPRAMYAGASRRRMRSPTIRIRPLDKKNLAARPRHHRRDLQRCLVGQLGLRAVDRGRDRGARQQSQDAGHAGYIAIAELTRRARRHGRVAAQCQRMDHGPQRQAAALRLGQAWLASAGEAAASIRMPLMGVRKEYHGTPLGSTLALGVIGDGPALSRRARYAGAASFRWILEDNMPMRRMIEAVGAQALQDLPRLRESDL